MREQKQTTVAKIKVFFLVTDIPYDPYETSFINFMLIENYFEIPTIESYSCLNLLDWPTFIFLTVIHR